MRMPKQMFVIRLKGRPSPRWLVDPQRGLNVYGDVKTALKDARKIPGAEVYPASYIPGRNHNKKRQISPTVTQTAP
jgi:hypothetical protein